MRWKPELSKMNLARKNKLCGSWPEKAAQVICKTKNIETAEWLIFTGKLKAGGTKGKINYSAGLLIKLKNSAIIIHSSSYLFSSFGSSPFIA